MNQEQPKPQTGLYEEKFDRRTTLKQLVGATIASTFLNPNEGRSETPEDESIEERERLIQQIIDEYLKFVNDNAETILSYQPNLFRSQEDVELMQKSLIKLLFELHGVLNNRNFVEGTKYDIFERFRQNSPTFSIVRKVKDVPDSDIPKLVSQQAVFSEELLIQKYAEGYRHVGNGTIVNSPKQPILLVAGHTAKPDTHTDWTFVGESRELAGMVVQQIPSIETSIQKNSQTTESIQGRPLVLTGMKAPAEGEARTEDIITETSIVTTFPATKELIEWLYGPIYDNNPIFNDVNIALLTADPSLSRNEQFLTMSGSPLIYPKEFNPDSEHDELVGVLVEVRPKFIEIPIGSDGATVGGYLGLFIKPEKLNELYNILNSQ